MEICPPWNIDSGSDSYKCSKIKHILCSNQQFNTLWHLLGYYIIIKNYIILIIFTNMLQRLYIQTNRSKIINPINHKAKKLNMYYIYKSVNYFKSQVRKSSISGNKL